MDDYSGVTQITFSCKDLFSTLENTDGASKYLRLIGQNAMARHNGENNIRCAVSIIIMTELGFASQCI